VSIGVVIPVYKQGDLAVEAIRSAEAAFRRSETSGTIVVVNDGCPYLSTHLTGMAAAAGNPNIRYVRTANGGLSAARNVGIELLLADEKPVDAVFFLDADNRLLANSVVTFERALRQYADADWFYPNIERFGSQEFHDYTDTFDPLTEAFWNVCEAGSLVRMAIFERGVRFDETMRSGFEDWDFWITSLEHGFRGRHLQDSGFLYRKRPESMLTESERLRPEIVNYIRRKHSWIRNPRALVCLEQQYAPRYAILLADRGEVVLTTDPVLCQSRFSLREYTQRLYSFIQMPASHTAGAFFVTADSRILVHLEMLGLLHSVLSTLETLSDGAPIASCQIARSAGDRLMISTSVNSEEGHLSIMPIHIVRSIVQDEKDHWLRSLIENFVRPVMRLELPAHSMRSEMPALSTWNLVSACLGFRASAERGVLSLPRPDKQVGGPDRSGIFRELREITAGGVMRPLAKRRRYEVAFAVPYFDIGGVERVTTQVARALRHHGIGCHLVLIGEKEIAFTEQTQTAFDSVTVLFGQTFERWGAGEYFGASLTEWALQGQHANALGLLSAFDAVVVCQSADAAGLTGSLRRLGVVTASHVHVFDVTENGRLVGHPDIAVAYEHSLDLVAACSRMLASQLAARGVPREKIVTIENSTGIAEEVLRTQDWRQLRALTDEKRGEPVRVLYAGRFDEQKGMDRLSEIIAQRQSSSAFQFRVVGKNVLQADAQDLHGVVLEPAVYKDVELISLLAWADVLLLPSRYEGLPLILIEALTAGVVPIVADCGAVREAVCDGENGFVVSQARCVRETIERLDLLAREPELLAAMALKGIESMSARSWQEATREFRERLCALMEERKLSKSVAAGIGIAAELGRSGEDGPPRGVLRHDEISRAERAA